METEITKEEAVKRRQSFGGLNDAPFHTMPYTSKFAPSQKVEVGWPEKSQAGQIVDKEEMAKEPAAV